MIVPSLRMEMRQMTKTGIWKSFQMIAMKKKKRIWIVHAIRYVGVEVVEVVAVAVAARHLDRARDPVGAVVLHPLEDLQEGGGWR